MFRRLVLAVLLLTCGFAAGLVLTGRLRSATDAAAGSPTHAKVVPTAGSALSSSGFPDFSRVAAATVPAVTNISSLQVVRRSTGPFANDPFFQFFFGNQDDLFGSQRGVESSLGSGVIVASDGYILTNNHVIAGDARRRAQRTEVTVSLGDKRELRATVVGADPAADLALLKIPAHNLPTMPWGDSSKLKVAEWVLAIGNPYQLNQTVTLGIVSALGRRVGISAYEDFIQTDAAINPGNSGGALVNVRGELVGINTAIFSQSGGYQGIGFAVPSNLARRVIDDLIKYHEVRRGSIGLVELAPVTTEIAEQLGARNAEGVLVTRIGRASSAYQAGIGPGDIIIAFNGIRIDDASQLQRAIQDASIGSTATVRILRNGRQTDVRVPIRSSTSE
jgi:serine protease Do